MELGTTPPTETEIVIQITTRPEITPTRVPTFTATPTQTHTPLPSKTPTATNTQVIDAISTGHTATVQAIIQSTTQTRKKETVAAQMHPLRQAPPSHASTPQSSLSTSSSTSASSPPPSFPQTSTQPIKSSSLPHKRGEPLVLAHYFAWFDDWEACNISAGDKPLEPYHSDDPTAIARHVQQAREIGLDGFTLHWFAPGDRTDRNFGTLLAHSEGTHFTSSVVFSYHIWHGLQGGNHQNIGTALKYIIEQHAQHPNFLRLENKPVIFFTDVYRTPGTGETPQQFWATVRAQVDPQRNTIWIAEGLDASYLQVFDGLYVFKVSHAAYPHDYQKTPRWGAKVRDWTDRTGEAKLWIATIMPGWDDLRSGCKSDVRMPNTHHRLDRQDGAIYEATFEAAIQSNPDWLIVGSFNEWVEGTYIEPSQLYGDKYMHMTQTFINRFKK